MKEYVAYIDEAGDEGFGKLATETPSGQSRWLMIGACIVSRENDLKLPSLRNQILDLFPKHRARDLHFRNLNHAQKIVACQQIAAFQLGISVVMSHKVTIPGTKYEATFKKKQYLQLLGPLATRKADCCMRAGC
jgi:hypothetical protein